MQLSYPNSFHPHKQAPFSLAFSTSRLSLAQLGISSLPGGAVVIECAFEASGGAVANVSDVVVHAAPPKTAERMREKALEYAPPHPRCKWPLAANILDPVRVSLVCHGAAQVLVGSHCS